MSEETPQEKAEPEAPVPAPSESEQAKAAEADEAAPSKSRRPVVVKSRRPKVHELDKSFIPRLILASCFSLLALTATVYFVENTDPIRREQGEEAGSQFVEALVLGGSTHPEKKELSGYAVAWGLLSESKQGRLSPEEFIGSFEDLSHRCGVLEGCARDARARRKRRPSYLLRFSGLQGEPETLRLRLRLIRQDGEMKISDYAIEQVEMQTEDH